MLTVLQPGYLDVSNPNRRQTTRIDLTRSHQYGSHLQGRCDTRCVVPDHIATPRNPGLRKSSPMLTLRFPHRRRLPNHDRRIHRQPSDRQADPRPRHHLVLPFRLRRRHTSRRRHRPVPTGPVPHDERQDTHDPDRGGHVPGAVLFKQGHVDVSCLEGREAGIRGPTIRDHEVARH